ncbi:hypothetical protein N7470_009991 [Penicillium chermesinum]|nr:hypothetical protein N7470_009991 [Penicillium chermesinum]
MLLSKQPDERWLKFKGPTQVKFSDIDLGDPACQYDPKNVGRLWKIFQSSGCRRFELSNHIPPSSQVGGHVEERWHACKFAFIQLQGRDTHFRNSKRAIKRSPWPPLLICCVLRYKHVGAVCLCQNVLITSLIRSLFGRYEYKPQNFIS